MNASLLWLSETHSISSCIFIQAKLPFSYFQSFLALVNDHFFALYNFCNFILKRTLERKMFGVILGSFSVKVCEHTSLICNLK